MTTALRSTAGAADANAIGPVAALTPDQVAAIRLAHENGARVRGLAIEYGVGVRTLYRYIEQSPTYKPRSRKLTDDQVAEVIASPYPSRVVAAALNVSGSLIRQKRREKSRTPDFTPLCMTADELADWAGGRRHSGIENGHVVTLTPCHDCMPDYALEMRALGKCNGHPRGVEFDEDEPPLIPSKPRRHPAKEIRHMAQVQVKIVAPCDNCHHFAVCSRTDALSAVNEGVEVSLDTLPKGISLALSASVDCDAYMPIKKAQKHQISEEGRARMQESGRALAARRNLAVTEPTESQA